MRRVAVTGVGILSSIGNGKDEVTQSLRNMTSGITANATYQEMAMRSQVSGEIDLDLAANIDRKHYRFMGDAAAFSYLAMQEALADAGLEPEQIKNPQVGLITGSGGGSTASVGCRSLGGVQERVANRQSLARALSCFMSMSEIHR